MTRKISSTRSSIHSFVLDGSVALAWCFFDESSPYADAIARILPTLSPIVPVIWHLEVANALLVGERRKRSEEKNTSEWIRYLTSLPITVDDQTTSHAFQDILSLARTHHLSAYDAAYLELASRRNIPLATLDTKLKNAAKTLGIARYEP